MVKQLQVKLSSAEKYIQQLKSSEHSMEKHKKVRSDKKKLTIFWSCTTVYDYYVLNKTL